MTKLGPHGHARLATFLCAWLASTKSQKEIAQRAGFKTPDMITTPKLGDTKLALDRVAAFARAIEVDLGVSIRSRSIRKGTRPRQTRSRRSSMASPRRTRPSGSRRSARRAAAPTR